MSGEVTEEPVAGDPAEPDSEIRELREALDRSEKEAVAAKDMVRRAQADLANVRRRAEVEREDSRARLLVELGKGFLPVLDDLERAARGAGQDPAEEGDSASGAMLAGVRLVLRRFEETLGQHGFSEVPALGEIFDPLLHEAVHRAPATDDQKDEEVIEVFRRGFAVDGRLVRPATVAVAARESQPAAEENESAESAPAS